MNNAIQTRPAPVKLVHVPRPRAAFYQRFVWVDGAPVGITRTRAGEFRVLSYYQVTNRDRSITVRHRDSSTPAEDLKRIAEAYAKRLVPEWAHDLFKAHGVELLDSVHYLAG